MPPRSRCALSILCWAISASGQIAPPATARNLHIVKVTKAPVIEDYLVGTGPDGAAPITAFIQRNPDDGKPASGETKAWLAYDDENLYAIFVCKTGPGE